MRFSFYKRMSSAALVAILPLCAAAIDVNLQSRLVTQNFDSMWDDATQTATLAMPDGWRVDRQMNAPRTVGTYASAQTVLMYEGGTSLASNAKNGTWNFGSSSDASDRAVGGLSTTVSGGTRCVSVMTCIHNAAEIDIEKLTLTYDIEKYRKGSNTAGFAVQVYYSADGSTWVSAGDNLYTYFSPDDETLGDAVVPISTTAVADKVVKVSVPAGTDIYLAWNISVASGSSPNLAMGLALDNVSVQATYAGDTNLCYVYAENIAKWSPLLLNGTEASGSSVVNGVNYTYFELDKDGAQHELVFSNGGSQSVTGPTIVADDDYYFTVTKDEVITIDDPENYTGYVDPSRPPFVASGIYLRGEVNSWGAPADWEFSDEGNGTYVLYDKQLSGNFKVADASWSSACNYGSNGTSILMDTPYNLVLGTNDNISCGSNSFTCTRIVLTIANGAATLLLESNDDDGDLTSVYVIGDLNGWNYMDASGELTLTDGHFVGQVTMPASADGLSHWRIYQRLGMGGVWGAPQGEDVTESHTSGTLVKGSTASMATAPGTYIMTFDLETGNFDMQQIESQPVSMALEPADVVLVPELPEQVKVLSLNNSLIHYNDQDAMFNSIATAMGRDAVWTKHSLLGKPLSAHWEEGDGLAEDGTPGAKMLIRNEAWSHIILQEQSALPRTNPEAFFANVKKFVDYIRDYCPNPNAVIIVPVNWAYSGDWSNFTDFNRTFVANYMTLARDLGITLCPVGLAYQDAYEREGADALLTWFQDDRHPTEKSTYMAACMEYGLIMGEDVGAITWRPASVSSSEALAMRDYAARALANFDNVVDHNAGVVRFTVTLRDQFGMAIESATPITMTLSGGGEMQGTTFIASGDLGDYTLTSQNDRFTTEATIHVVAPETTVVKFPAIVLDNNTLTASENFDGMGVDTEATLPEAWRIDRQFTAPRTVGRYDLADDKTMYAGGVNLASNAKNGTWNFGATDDSDRAPGGISTGVAGGTRCVNLYAHLRNEGRKNIQNLQLTYDVEKYRQGANSAGFAVQLYYSLDGRNWESAGSGFRTYFAPDAVTQGYANVPGEVVSVSSNLNAVIERGCDFYLAWNISVADGDAAQAAMAIGIDNFTITGELPPVPTAKHYIYADDQTGWDALGLYAWGDSELFGPWPGEASVDEVEIGGRTFKKFLLDTDTGLYHLIFNNWNNGLQLPDYNIEANRDCYFMVTTSEVFEVVPSTAVTDVRATEYITFDGRQVMADGMLMLFDINGRLLSTGNGAIAVDRLPAGIYVVRTADGKAMKIRR